MTDPNANTGTLIAIQLHKIKVAGEAQKAKDVAIEKSKADEKAKADKAAKAKADAEAKAKIEADKAAKAAVSPPKAE